MRTLVAVVSGVAIAAAGCGGSDSGDSGPEVSSGADLAAAFGEHAADAYAANDLDRKESFAQGTTVDGCFFLDQDGGGAIADATGTEYAEVAVSKENFISGQPDQEETMICSLNDPAADGDPGLIATVGAGTTLANPEQYLERSLRVQDAAELEGSAEGLDADEVVAFERQGIRSFVWVHDDFVIGVSGPEQALSAEAGFAALPVAVEEVSRTLTGE